MGKIYDYSLIIAKYSELKSISATATALDCSINTVRRAINGLQNNIEKDPKKVTICYNERSVSPYGKVTLSPSQVKYLGLTKDDSFIDFLQSYNNGIPCITFFKHN